MKKYSVNGTVVGGKYLGTFEAETPEEAEQKALAENGSVNLCHHCASECENAQITETTVEEEAAE